MEALLWARHSTRNPMGLSLKEHRALPATSHRVRIQNRDLSALSSEFEQIHTSLVRLKIILSSVLSSNDSY